MIDILTGLVAPLNAVLFTVRNDAASGRTALPIAASGQEFRNRSGTLQSSHCR